MKTPPRNVIKAHLAQIAQLACRVPLLRLHPKLRWLDAVCPLVEQIGPDEVPKKRRKKHHHQRRDRLEQLKCKRWMQDGRP